MLARRYIDFLCATSISPRTLPEDADSFDVDDAAACAIAERCHFLFDISRVLFLSRSAQMPRPLSTLARLDLTEQ